MYPDYLVHFNPNHDPKTGQFAPSKWNVKNGYQTNKGTLTEKGKKNVDVYNTYETKMRKKNDEARKLFDQSEFLQDDFVSPDEIDDWDFFELVAEEYGYDISKFRNARIDEEKFWKENKDAINTGRTIVMKSNTANAVNRDPFSITGQYLPENKWLV